MVRIVKRFMKLQHLLMQRNGGYTFIKANLFKLLLSIGAILGIFYLFDAYIFDIDSAAKWATEFFSPQGLVSIFFLSEISIGFITPELLIVWADETLKPRWMLTILASLSYLAGIIGYFLGQFWRTRAFVRNFLLDRYKETFSQLNRFGGLLIVLAALTPLPYPIVSQLSGMNDYPFQKFALLTLVRFLRFAIYGALLYNLF
jgi:membrane protein YqaA with SNARE-associated domain